MKRGTKTGIIKDLALNQTNRPLDCFLFWRDRDGGGLELYPPYQRGDVWGHKRRVNLIRSLLMGVPIPSIILNDRLSADWPGDYRKCIIDGKQRITTILMFLDDELEVPREWFDGSPGLVSFSMLSNCRRLGFKNMPIACSEARIKTLAGEKEIFDLVNFGGLQQGEVDTDL